MKFVLFSFLIYTMFISLSAGATCKIILTKRVRSVQFVCTELTNLENLDKARKNTTAIEITNSNIQNVPGHTFARFGATLKTLDMHNSGIMTIDSQAFIGLTSLEKLILWGNKLRIVPRDWFINTYNLRTLDISFNFIQEIDFAVYQMLPYLENFYFDYNELQTIHFTMFAALTNLKRVRFGKNPLNWAYRTRLTWQLENQHVNYTEEWEDWNWMSNMIRRCIETGQGEIPNDTVLDCLVGKLLDFTYESETEQKQQPVSCNDEARRLVRCMRPRNSTSSNTDNETIRMILENYVTVLPRMSNAQGPFSLPTY